MEAHDGIVAREAAIIYKELFDRVYAELAPAYRQHGGVPKSEVLSLCRSRRDRSMAALERKMRGVSADEIAGSLSRLLLAGHLTRECVSMFMDSPRPKKDRYSEGELFTLESPKGSTRSAENPKDSTAKP